MSKRHRKTTVGVGSQSTRPATNNLTCKIEFAPPEYLYRDAFTPAAVKHAKQQAAEGRLQAIQALFDTLYKEDDTVSGDTDVRTEAAKTAIYTLPEGLSKQQEEYFHKFLRRFLPDLIDQTMDLRLCGLAFRQIIYKLSDAGGTGPSPTYEVVGFEECPGADLRLENGELVYYDHDTPKTLPEAQFLRFWGNYPVYESLLRYYTFKSFALTNWASFMETYGKPVRIGKYRAGTPQNEKDKLWSMIQSLGTDLAAMISENTLIEFVEHKNITASSNLYSDLLTFCEKNVTKRILGQVLTTNAQETGSYAQAKVHNLVREDILQGDLREAGLYVSKVCSLLNHINFGTEDIEVTLTKPEQVDLATAITIDERLNTIIEIDPEYFYKKYNIPEPEGGYRKAVPVHTTFSPFMSECRMLNAECREGNEISIANGEHHLNNSAFSIQHSALSKPLTPNSETPNPLSVGEGPVPPVPISLLAMPAEIDFQSKNHLNKQVDLTSITAKMTQYLNSLHSYEDVKNAPFPTDVYLEYGTRLADEILQAYTHKPRKPHGNGRSCLPLQATEQLPYIPPKMPEPTFDFNLTDAVALGAFRSHAFVVAGIDADEQIAALKQHAESAIANGTTFNDFRKHEHAQALPAYRLKTNFDTAINSAYQARAWVDQWDAKDTFKYLQYVCVNDDRTRDEHRDLNGIVKEITDPWWDKYYPPNGWNCRCSTRSVTQTEYDELRKGKKLKTAPTKPPAVKEDFQKNVGSTYKIGGHKYSQDNIGIKKTFTDHGLQDIKDMEKHTLPDMLEKIDLTGLHTKEEKNDAIINAINEVLKTIGLAPDKQGFIVWLTHIKRGQLIKKTTDDLMSRYQRIPAMIDTIADPDEIWVEWDSNGQNIRIKYIKNYDKPFIVISDIVKGKLNSFHFYPLDRPDKDLNSDRIGFLLFTRY